MLEQLKQEIDEITNQIESMQNIGFESEKEIERITAEINKLYEQRTELEVALASYDSTSEG